MSMLLVNHAVAAMTAVHSASSVIILKSGAQLLEKILKFKQQGNMSFSRKIQNFMYSADMYTIVGIIARLLIALVLISDIFLAKLHTTQ